MSKQTFVRTVFPVIAIALAALIAAALPSMAQSKSQQQMSKALDSIIKTATDVKGDVGKALESLQGIAANQDSKSIEKEFKAFSKQVDAMSKAREEAKKNQSTYQAKRAEYIKTWSQEMESVSNPDIRQTMEQRQAEVTKMLEGLKPSFETAVQSFDPFLSDLKDTQKMLSMDLSSAGVQAASPAITKSLEDGKTVVANLDALLTALNEAKQQM